MPLLQAFWLFLPAGVANMAPSLLRRLPFLNVPLDGGLTFLGKRIFGDHKTLRGFIAAPLAGFCTFWAQQQLDGFAWARSISLFDYSEMSLSFGWLLGLGAIVGDAVKSFFKRQANRDPGQPWIPFDQIDFTIGAMVMVQCVYQPPLSAVFLVILLGLILHPLANLIGFLLKFQNNKL